MPRLLLFITATTTVFCLSHLKCISPDPVASDTRYNVVWIVAEDLSPVLPMYGDSTIKTPHLSALASQGVTFDNAFSPSGVCAPSRAALATGCYPTRIGADHMRTGPWFSNLPQTFIDQYRKSMSEYGVDIYQALPPPSVRMMSEIFRENGYYTTNNSKEDYQFRTGTMAWDENGSSAHWKNRNPNQPFFSIFNLGVTHESQIWARANDTLLVNPDLEVPVPPYLPNTDSALIDIRRMYSNAVLMDQQIGEIIQELADADVLDNTIVWYYSDHGGPLPRQKRLTYDSGLRVPLIIRYPNGQNANTREERLVSFVDFGATALSQCGIKASGDIDGLAFDGTYEDPHREYIYAAADRFDETTDMIRTIRDGRYKYIRYLDPEKPMFLRVKYREQMAIMRELYRLRDADELTPEQALWFRSQKPKEELFDTATDPHEINNLANSPLHTEVKDRLSSGLDEWLDSFEDLNAIPELELLKRLLPDGQIPKTDIDHTVIDNEIILSSRTAGASLGYRLLPQDSMTSSWRLYESPLPTNDSISYELIAHRLGYEPSEVLTVQ